MEDLEDVTRQVKELSLVVGDRIRAQEAGVRHNEDLEIKGKSDYVTEVDKDAEQTFVKGLSKILPEAGFIAEEKTSEKKGVRYSWVIDPLDGTTNFIHDVPAYCTSVALLDGEEVILGVIYDPTSREMFHAWKGGGAHLNDEAIRVSDAQSLEESLMATGFPYQEYDKLETYVQFFARLTRTTRGVRRFGSAAIDLAWVACGRFEVFYEFGLSPWDVAAGSLIVEEAGGKVCDFKGGPGHLFGKQLVASCDGVWEEFMERLGRSGVV